MAAGSTTASSAKPQIKFKNTAAGQKDNSAAGDSDTSANTTQQTSDAADGSNSQATESMFLFVLCFHCGLAAKDILFSECPRIMYKMTRYC